MKQKDLYERLESSLSTYTILDVDVDWPFGWDLTREHQTAKEPGKGARQDRRAAKDRRTARCGKASSVSGITSTANRQYAYDIRRDKRLMKFLKEIGGSGKSGSFGGSGKSGASSGSGLSPDNNETVKILGITAMTVVSGLSKYSLCIPSAKEMDELLSIAGVTPTEMNIFYGTLLVSDLTCLGTVSVRPVAVLFYRVLWNALCESCGEAGWIKEQEPQGGSSHTHWKRLQAFVDYLIDNRLLELNCLHGAYSWEKDGMAAVLDEDIYDAKVQEAIEKYDNFFLRCALLECKSKIAFDELKETTNKSDREAERILKQTQKLMLRIIKNNSRINAAARSGASMPTKPIPSFFQGAPCNLPLSDSSFVNPLSGNPVSENPFISFEQMQNSDLSSPASFLNGMEKAKALTSDGWRKEAASLLEKEFHRRLQMPGMAELRKGSQDAYVALNNYCSAVRGNCINALNQIARQQAGFLAGDVGEDIAEYALVALLNEDECYKLDISKYIFSYLGRLLSIPGTEPMLPELQDEEEWDDFIWPGDNGGKLAQSIMKEDEVIVHGKEDENACLLKTVSLSGAISDFSGYQFNEGLFIRKSHVAAFRELGYSERRSRDFAIIVATLRYALEHEGIAGGRVFSEPGNDSGDENSSGGGGKQENTIDKTNVDGAQTSRRFGRTPSPTQDPQPTADDLRLLVMERDEAIKKQKNAERESQKLRHDVAEGNRIRKELEEELERVKEQLGRQDELIDAYTQIEEEQGKPGQKEGRITFPFITDRNVILYGGFHVFHTELEKLIPGIRIVEPTSHINTMTFRNADIIFLQINKTNHSNYWNVCDTAKNAGVPYYHLNFANARRCAEEMAKRIMGLK